MYKVLITEDEEFILQGIQTIIDWEAIGLSLVHMAHNGKEALSLLEQEETDIIITDISMPVMDGLTLLTKVREKNRRCRFIIISGYDDFDYAKKAIPLDVEDYILKPIDEEQLEAALKGAIAKLDAPLHRQLETITRKEALLDFLENRMSLQDSSSYANQLRQDLTGKYAGAAILRFDKSAADAQKIFELLSFLDEQKTACSMKNYYYDKAEVIIIKSWFNDSASELLIFFQDLQNRLENQLGLLTFITVGFLSDDLTLISDSYKEADRLKKYLMIEGYGNCICQDSIETRKTADVSLDSETLHKLILAKNQTGACRYVEDLFINTAKKENLSPDAIYRLSIKISMFLQEISEEFKLQKLQHSRNLSELLEELYHAENISVIKAIFISQVAEIIELLHTEDSKYTPVVKQILSEVKNYYCEDMNLKTLAHKYNINSSYLGQIFQKEVGCPFSQYLTNVKNAKARELILNTNMKINDIAAEVGYTDTSYFYRKFKQCYGVSPASLREIIKY